MGSRTNPFNYFWYLFSLSAITSYNGNAFILTKIVLVVILTILVTIINLITKKAIQTKNFEKLKLVESIGKITMTLALTIVVIAVIIFN